MGPLVHVGTSVTLSDTDIGFQFYFDSTPGFTWHDHDLTGRVSRQRVVWRGVDDSRTVQGRDTTHDRSDSIDAGGGLPRFRMHQRVPGTGREIVPSGECLRSLPSSTHLRLGPQESYVVLARGRGAGG